MLMFIVGMVAGGLLVFAVLAALSARKPGAASVDDKALIVSFLQAHGQSDVLQIRCGMREHTRGHHDWLWKKREQAVYRALRSLEADGTVTSRIDRIRTRVWSLVAAPDALLNVEAP